MAEEKALEPPVPAGPLTKEAVEKDIRAINRWCRGPNLHSLDERWAFKKTWDLASPAEHEKLLEDVVASLKGKKGVRKIAVDEIHKAALAAPDREAAIRNLSFNLIHGFQDSINGPVCGQNVNDLIIKDGQYDGETHEVICPKCGQKHTYSKMAEIAEPVK